MFDNFVCRSPKPTFIKISSVFEILIGDIDCGLLGYDVSPSYSVGMLLRNIGNHLQNSMVLQMT
jgi:hypothetical protein